MTTRTLIILLAALSSAAAAQSLDQSPAPLYGEAVSGMPNWEERTLLALSNRARVDPATELADCTQCSPAELSGCYSPVAPFTLNPNLGEAARFHAHNMAQMNFFAHNSACRIRSDIASVYPDSCDASASCACTSGTATTTFARISLFGSNGSAENIAWGYTTPMSVFYGFLHEPAPSSPCSFNSSNGHRWNILKNGGPGHGAGYYGNYWTQDLGQGTSPSTIKLVSGSHWTSGGARQGSTVEFWANWYDTAGPSQANVVVNGTSHAMTLARGNVTNGAWSTSLGGLGSGCHRYYFSFRSAGGTEYRFPSTGSFGIGSPETCPDWDGTSGAAPLVDGDLNGDGRADLIWRNQVSGENSVWFLNAVTVTGGGAMNAVSDTNWVIGGTGDFNADGKSDLLWRHAPSGSNVVWFMNGAAYVSQAAIPSQTDPAWSIGGVGDADGDGDADIFWRNGTSGANAVWLMNGTSLANAAEIPAVTDLTWEIAGSADLDGNGTADLILWNSFNGSVAAWFMNGATRTGMAFVGQVSDTSWHVAAVGDFTGDGDADIVWQHSGGSTALWALSNGAAVGGGFIGLAPNPWQISGAR